MQIVTIERKVLQKNQEIAQKLANRFKSHHVIVYNLISSPGSGKTSLLEKTLDLIKSEIKVAVIEGDVQTDQDAQRIAKHDIPVVQIVTHGGCHLDANLIEKALEQIDLYYLKLLFIENVGNLVCPAGFDLGEQAKIVIASTTEGDDKPLKYPQIFRAASVCLLNKIDLLPYLDFDVQRFQQNAQKINPDMKFFHVSAKTGDGMPAWIDWLKNQIALYMDLT